MPRPPLPDRLDRLVTRVCAEHELRQTPLRRKILRAFARARSPLSQADLLEQIDVGADRVSLYRNLMRLREQGVIHEIAANRYVWCRHPCVSHAHLLLFCERCQAHREVSDHPAIERVREAIAALHFFSIGGELHIKGICSACEN